MANFKVYFKDGNSKTIKNVGYFVNKTHVIFYKVGKKREKKNIVAQYKLSKLRTDGKKWKAV